MRYRGHVDAMRNHVVAGWAASLQAPDHPLTVVLLIDGKPVAECRANRYRPDLKEAGIGNGRNGFMMAIPDAAFDGQSHSVGVRIKGWRQLLIGRRELVGRLDGVRLDLQHKAAFEGAVTGVERGVMLRGYLRNSSAGAEPVLVDLLLDGRPIAQALATEATPGGRAAAGCGFSFNLRAHWRPELLSGRLECCAAGTANLFPAHDAIRRAISVDHVQLVENRIEGAIRLPAFVPANSAVDLRLDGKTLPDVDWRSSPREFGGALKQFSAPKPPVVEAEPPMLEIRLRDLDHVVGGRARALMPQSPNLLRNAQFQAWRGDRPVDWNLADESITRIVPEHCLLDMSDAEMPIFGPLAARFEIQSAGGERNSSVPAGATAPIRLISQTLNSSGLPNDGPLEWQLVARCSPAIELSIVLELESGDGAQLPLRAASRLGPRWTSLAGSFVLPTDVKPRRHARLVIEIPDGSYVVHIAAIGLGLKGFVPAPEAASELPDDIAEGTNAHPNSVCNGDFAAWRRGLAFSATSSRFETADDWFFYSKVAQPAISISVEKVLTRDPARPEATREVYGLSLQGGMSASCRLEAVLDPVSLRANPPERLRFYACRKTSALPVDPAAPVAIIARILLVRRIAEVTATIGGQPASTDEKLCTIARKVLPGAAGRYYEFRIPALEVDWPEVLGNNYGGGFGDSQFLLMFEFEDALECVLADVDLSAQVRTSRRGLVPGFVGVEDPNIAHQIDLIKGIENWGKPAIDRADFVIAERIGRQSR